MAKVDKSLDSRRNLKEILKLHVLCIPSVYYMSVSSIKSTFGYEFRRLFLKKEKGKKRVSVRR